MSSVPRLVFSDGAVEIWNFLLRCNIAACAFAVTCRRILAFLGRVSSMVPSCLMALGAYRRVEMAIMNGAPWLSDRLGMSILTITT